ncbi:LysR family transcriptional regulator [Palleronia caenipelagi]|uniref:LysR family transcriptional regulator n=2 Tax=Palleronia caenipelagi TaxID=2489174 RepID=A0A547Q950_9RHOB|nr:LysR family transcriptional regulator [Palleronia caenipelagi]
MSALVAFEAAARHVGFKAAARELNVTPAAISHQVKALETELRCALFNRHHRGVELTEAGAYLLVALQRGFEAMGEAVGQLRQNARRSSVVIRVTTAVSTLWLTPKLAQFWKAHPDVSVAQIVSDTDLLSTDCDLSIHYGVPPARDPTCRALFADRIMALGSPRFATAHPVRGVGDLAALPLIQFDSTQTGWTGWAEWFRAVGHDAPVQAAHRVNNYAIALQAARDDMGAVLGWVDLARVYLQSGELVPLLPDAVETGDQFYVRLHRHATDRSRLVHDWLLRNCQA